MLVRRTARLFGCTVSAAALVGGFLAAGSASASAEDPTPVVVQQDFTTADGVALRTTLTSPGPVETRPTVVEFSPYGNNSQTFSFGPDYNYLLVQIRGTGSSRGSFDALGPRTQRDVVEVGAAGLDLLTGSLPLLTHDQLAGLTGLTYTTPALTAPVDLAGPLSFEVPLSTTTPDSGIWVVLSDVVPDGTSHPLTVGRLSTSYPDVVEGRSLVDSNGTIVQPYGDYSAKKPAKPLQWRNYRVELWPVGNRFRAGHKIRLSVVGTSAASMPALPALHSVRVGGPDGARLLVPVLPGSDLRNALGG